MKKILLLLVFCLPATLWAQTPIQTPVSTFVESYQGTLYKNCEHRIEALMMGLGRDYDVLYKNYNPVYTMADGKIRRGEDSLNVLVVPQKEGKAVLEVKANGYKGIIKFLVVPIPPPKLVLIDAAWNEISCSGLLAKVPSYVSLKPDETFFKAVPKEANFRISEYTITIYRNGKQIATQKTQGKIPDKDIQSGDMVQIVVTKGERINSRGELEDCTPKNDCINFMMK